MCVVECSRFVVELDILSLVWFSGRCITLLHASPTISIIVCSYYVDVGVFKRFHSIHES